MTHICVSKLTIIGSDNGLAPGRRQTIIWTNDGISLIGPLGTNFREILIGIQTFSFKKMHLKMSSAKWRPFCLGLNELRNKTCLLGHQERVPFQYQDHLSRCRNIKIPIMQVKRPWDCLTFVMRNHIPARRHLYNEMDQLIIQACTPFEIITIAQSDRQCKFFRSNRSSPRADWPWPWHLPAVGNPEIPSTSAVELLRIFKYQ